MTLRIESYAHLLRARSFSALRLLSVVMVSIVLTCGCEDVPCEEDLSDVQARYVGDYAFSCHWWYQFCMQNCYQERHFEGTVTCSQDPTKIYIEYMSGYKDEFWVREDGTIHMIHSVTQQPHKAGQFADSSVAFYVHIGGRGGYDINVTGVRR